MFVLCKKYAETENQSICNHSVGDRSLPGTWVSVELQKAVQLGYTLLKVYEVWQYDTITQYDPCTGDGGLFAQYMNTFMKIKMKASGYPSHRDTDQEKTKYIERVRVTERITLRPDDILFNERRTVAKLCFYNIWEKFIQTPDITIKEFITEPRRFYHLLSDDGFEVSDVHHVNDCLYVSYKKLKEFQTPSLNTNVIIVSYVTTYAILELYSYLEQLKDCALYCDTDSVLYRHIVGEYNPPFSEFVGGMTGQLGGSHMIEYVSNGKKIMQSVQQMVNKL